MSASCASTWQGSRGRLIGSAALAALLWVACAFLTLDPVKAQSAKPAAAAPTCATCHVGITTSYAHAPMRHALESPGADPVLDTHPSLTVQQAGYTYTVQTKDGHSTYSVTDGKDTLTVPIRWMFGQHSQTWVLEKDGNLYEGLVSYFPRDNGLASTPGDGKIVPTNLTEAMGRRLTIWEVVQCFSCHASGATSGVKLTLDKTRPGLECERCHVGSELHLTDAAAGNFATLPKPLKKMSAQDSANFCGQCHRTWDTVMRNNWKGPVDVRFQPYRLENSRCFIGNDSRISCLACHDPHQPVNHDDTFYDSKCLACHAAAAVAVATVPTKTCPVAKAKCASCHMPKVELPGGHALFTDHQIRIVHPGDPYPN